MKTSIKRLLILIISLTLLFTILLLSCKNNNKENEDNKEESGSGIVTVPPKPLEKLEEYYKHETTVYYHNLTLKLKLYDVPEKNDPDFKYKIEDLYYEISGIDENIDMETYTVIDSYDGIPINSIKEDTFCNLKYIKKLIFPQNIEYQKMSLFNNNEALQEIILPSNITEIEESMFSNCKSLITINMGDSIKSIGNSAFYNCKFLTTINIGDSVEAIGHGAFAQCSSLKEIVIPKNVKEIGEYVFSGCNNLEKIVINSNNISIIGEFSNIGANPFSGINKNTIFEITEDNTDLKFVNNCLYSISNKTVYFASDFNNIKNIEEIDTIANGAFEINKFLEEIKIPDNIKNIGTGVFTLCINLRIIDLGENVEAIGDAILYGNTLESVVLPRKISVLNKNIFTSANIENLIIESEVTFDFEDTNTLKDMFENIDNIYIKLGVDLSPAIEEYYQKTISDKEGYDKYIKKSI